MYLTEISKKIKKLKLKNFKFSAKRANYANLQFFYFLQHSQLLLQYEEKG